MNYDYESDWKDYVFPEQESEMTHSEEMKERLTETSLNSMGDAAVSGIPIISDGETIYVNDETEHSIIFGETASKKTRSCIKPAIIAMADNEESMFVSDVKGEISSDPKIIGFLQEKEYKIVYLDFRRCSGDGYNILEHSFNLYRKGNKDKAMSSVSDMIEGLQEGCTGAKDPFWDLMASQFLIPIIHILYEICRCREEYYEYVNMLTLSCYTSEDGAEILNEIMQYNISATNNSTEMLRNVLSTPERTRASIVGTAASYLKDFLLQENLLKMLSHSTFDVQSMYEKPTCVFLIVPDEVSTYDRICGILVHNFYGQLIERYSEKYQNKSVPRRVNFLIDEFCNLNIPGMGAKISASRSRSMRWFLVCQSKQQLERYYEQEAATIIGNCKNIFFLQSSDYEMLEYISLMCGDTTITESGRAEPLVSVERLKKLRKTDSYKEAIYLRDNVKYLARLLDIDQYRFLEKYQETPILPVAREVEVKAYPPKKMVYDLDNKIIPPPFSNLSEEMAKKLIRLESEEVRNLSFESSEEKRRRFERRIAYLTSTLKQNEN